MRKNLGIRLLVMCGLFLLLTTMVYAAVDKSDAVSGGAVTEGALSGSITETSAETHAAQGGNVSEIDVSSTASTIKWAGLFGEVTTSLKLGISSDVLYDFGSAANDQIKTVLASTDSSFDFSQLQAATAANVDSTWGFVAGDVDSATSVFIGSSIIATVGSVPSVGLNAHDSDNTLNTSLYNSGLLADTASPSVENDFVFGVSVEADELAFDNLTTIDYELIVPVSDGGTGILETYYLFLDIE